MEGKSGTLKRLCEISYGKTQPFSGYIIKVFIKFYYLAKFYNLEIYNDTKMI